MQKLAIALAALAAICVSGVAFAEDAAKSPLTMSDSEMDRVTAGAPGSNGNTNYTNGHAYGAYQGNGYWKNNDEHGRF
jgi:hypothetical protein